MDIHGPQLMNPNDCDNPQSFLWCHNLVSISRALDIPNLTGRLPWNLLSTIMLSCGSPLFIWTWIF